ncbi:hypothetical protein F5146DRAFT_921957 [Armillaria mellea]|nr:hypothetical protein F5146DRAFT_921957 [Armillaria mellea]
MEDELIPHITTEGNAAALVWDDLSREQKQKLTLAMADMYSSILSLRFDMIGSFYEGRGRFFIGPIVTTETIEAPDTAPDPKKCGPFLSTAEWLGAVKRQDTAFARPPSSDIHTPTHQSHVQSIISDIQSSTTLATDKTPIVFHIDFSMQNIIVRSDDPTVIAGIIDWEGARTVPMWSTNPRFVWLIFLPDEEWQHFRGVFLNHLTEQIPEWYRAVSGEETFPMRLLLERAKYSTWSPNDFDWSVPPRHFLCEDVASQTCIVYEYHFPVNLCPWNRFKAFYATCE